MYVDYSIDCDLATGVCPLCKRPGEKHWRRNCVKKVPGEPRFAGKIFNFTRALIFHVVRGMPTCSQQQIDERFAICKTCPLYDSVAAICTHKDCGCSVLNQAAFLNKLAWADQKCPAEKWDAIPASDS